MSKVDLKQGESNDIRTSEVYIIYDMGTLWFTQDILIRQSLMTSLRHRSVDDLQIRVEEFKTRLNEMLAELEL